jgi:channel protein (hemolysin III family)
MGMGVASVSSAGSRSSQALSVPRSSRAGFNWLFLGGVAYTTGVLFYVLDKLNRLTHAHGIWHAFVLVGSVAHFTALIGYVR